ncbi:O-antigen ligase family protein [Escherichia albertii]|nr:O-antigen ligase family protein [Escherichia albertii]
MYKIKNRFDLDEVIYGTFVSLLFFGYPVFSILATIFEQDSLTIFYRGLCIFIGLLSMVIPSKKFGWYASYSIVQILVIFLHLIYLSWVMYYFSNGYRNENLDLSFYVNNSVLFSLIPILLLSKKLTLDSLFILKIQFNCFILMFITLTFIAYALGLNDQYRLSFEKINPISLSLYAAIGVLFCSWSFRSKVISTFVIVLLLSIMILSGSRGPLLALFFITCISIVFRLSFIKKIYAVIVAAALSFGITVFYDNLVDYIPILSRFNVATTEGSLSVNIREEQYKSAIDIFSNHPYFGGSLVEKFTFFYPHNIVIEILITGGIVLFFIYLLVFASFLVEIIKALRNKVPVCFVYVFFLLLVSYMFTSSLAGMGLFYFVIVIISKMKLDYKYDKYNHC